MSTGSVWKKLAEVRKNIGPLRESGYNQFGKYSYSTEADLSEAYVQPMLDAGLYIAYDTTESSVTYEERKSFNRNGEEVSSYYNFATITVMLTVACTETGETEHFSFVGHSSDKGGDKAVYQALTGACKYGLKKLLNIAGGEDADKAPKETTSSPARSPRRAASSSSKPAKKTAPSKKRATASSTGEVSITNAMRLAVFSQELGYGKDEEYWVMKDAMAAVDKVDKKDVKKDQANGKPARPYILEMMQIVGELSGLSTINATIIAEAVFPPSRELYDLEQVELVATAFNGALKKEINGGFDDEF